MPFPTLRFLRRPWLLLAAPLLLSAAFATAAVAPPTQDAPPPPNCLEDVVGGALQCSAKDVRVAQYRLVEGPKECLPGQVIEVKLQAELDSGARDRYDIGLFVAQDGGSARRGTCYRDYLPPPLAPSGQYDPGTAFTPPAQGQSPVFTGGGPFLTAEKADDLCGDIEQRVPTFRDLGEISYDPKSGPVPVKVTCQDNVDAEGNPVPDQVADVGTCVSWDNQPNASPVCSSAADTKPGTTSKCNCSYVQIAGLTVPEVARLEVIKDIVPASDPGKFDLLIDGVVKSGAAGVGDGGSTGSLEVSAGTRTAPGANHTVAEIAYRGTTTDLGGYEISYECLRNGEAVPFASGSGPAEFTVHLMPGDNAVCTITNRARPRLRLIKVVRNDNGGTAAQTDWRLYAKGARTEAPTNLDGKSPVDSAALGGNFEPDTYELSETYIDADPGVPNGYTASAWSCVKTASNEPVRITPHGQVVINYGDDVTCTVVNDDIQPRLKLVKRIEIKYGGTTTPADFQASVVNASGDSRNLPWDAFTGLNAGSYKANETVLAGYSPSEWTGDCAADGAIALLPGDEKTCYITNSDNPPPPNGPKVCVDGYVINHREQPVDGTQTNPPLVVNAVREAPNGGTGVASEVLATAPVGANGYFKFASLPADTPISFQLQLPPDWEGIVPQVRLGGVAATSFTSFQESATCYRILFKIRRLVTLTVSKWEEGLNGRVRPGGDWTITATPLNDPFAQTVVVTTTAAPDGAGLPPPGQAYLALTPGTWRIAETVKPGWTPLTPPILERVIAPYGPAGNGIVFKNREPVCHPQIVVEKLGYGTNSRGERQALGPLSGWTFTVRRADGASPAITKATGGDGRAVFDGLNPGVYTVTETVQSGWKVRGDNPVTMLAHSCTPVNVTFENDELIGTLTISGRKLFKAWEKPYEGTVIGLPGWTITASLVGDGTSLTAVTNALGEYAFTQEQLKAAGLGFPGASIEVCEEQRDHWIPVTPACVTVEFPYPLPSDYTGARVDFTNAQDPPRPVALSTNIPPVSAGAGCRAYRTVVLGDTLAKIANRSGTSAGALMRANGIGNIDLIYPGQQLCIP